ncbi:hypothetical protein ABFX02_02G005400 [Erythranthe guttata]
MLKNIYKQINKCTLGESKIEISSYSGILCRAGIHEPLLLPFTWFAALNICLLRIKFSRCSNETGGGDAEVRRPKLRPSLIASSTCFRSSFFTIIFIRPSSAAAISPPLISAIASRILLAAAFWFLPDLENLNSLLCEEDFSSAIFDSMFINFRLSLSLSLSLSLRIKVRAVLSRILI